MKMPLSLFQPFSRPISFIFMVGWLTAPISSASLLAAPQIYDVSPFGVGNLLCTQGECEPAISKTTYFDRPAYKLSNGAVEAVIVPEIGRVMRWGKIGGPNLLWNSAETRIQSNLWKNYGGDKTWLAPQSEWGAFYGAKYKHWPPETVLDGAAHKAEVLSGGKLQMITGLSKTGIRITRTMYFDDKGEFVIEQTARKESGEPLKAGLWSISQAIPGQATFFAVDSDTQLKSGFHRFEDDNKINAELVRPNLVKVVPQLSAVGKLGFQTKVAALAAVRDGVAWVQKAARPAGDYPDGMGIPTEIFINGQPKAYYQELEILGPLQEFHKGTSWTHTVRWSLHDLPASDVNSPAVVEAVEKLLHG